MVVDLRRQRVTQSLVRQAVRSKGYRALVDVEAVVLETVGSLSVISNSRAGDGSALSDVLGEACTERALRRLVPGNG